MADAHHQRQNPDLVDPEAESLAEELSSSVGPRFPLAVVLEPVLAPSADEEEERGDPPRLETESGFHTFFAHVGNEEIEKRFDEELTLLPPPPPPPSAPGVAVGE